MKTPYSEVGERATISHSLRSAGEESGEEPTFRDVIDNFVTSFTAHGLGRIHTNTHWLKKILWLAVCSLFILYGISVSWSVLGEYNKFPTRVSIDVVEDAMVAFPAVTICNLNPLPSKKDMADHEVWKNFLQNDHQNPENSNSSQPDNDEFEHTVETEAAGNVKERIACSVHFSYVLFRQAEAEDGKIDLDVDTEDCPVENFTETANFNICGMIVICDDFGCYDELLRVFWQKIHSKVKKGVEERRICVSCSAHCIHEEWLTDRKDSLDYHRLEKMISKSRTQDLSDILEKFAPTREDITTFSVPKNLFINSCSFDGRRCSHTEFATWTSNQHGLCYTFNSSTGGGPRRCQDRRAACV